MIVATFCPLSAAIAKEWPALQDNGSYRWHKGSCISFACQWWLTDVKQCAMTVTARSLLGLNERDHKARQARQKRLVLQRQKALGAESRDGAPLSPLLTESEMDSWHKRFRANLIQVPLRARLRNTILRAAQVTNMKRVWDEELDQWLDVASDCWRPIEPTFCGLDSQPLEFDAWCDAVIADNNRLLCLRDAGPQALAEFLDRVANYRRRN